MENVIVPILVGVFSGIIGQVVTQVVTSRRERHSFRITKRAEAYNFFVFTVSGIVFGSKGEPYDFERMANEAIAKVALFASREVVDALHAMDSVEDYNTPEAYTAFLNVIAAMRRDIGTADQSTVDAIIKLRRIGRRVAQANASANTVN